MVEQVNIAQWVNRPSELKQAEATLLDQKIKQEPWCSTYHLLLAKAHFNEDSFLKNKYLKQAAMYAGDRKLLFDLIHSSDHIVVAEPEQIGLPTEETLTEKESEAHEIVINDVVEEIVEEVKEEEIQKEETEEQRVVEAIEEEPEKLDQLEEEPKEVKTPDSIEEKSEIQPVESKLEKEAKGLKVDFDAVVKYDPLKELKPEAKEEVTERVEIPFDRVVYNPEVELEKIIEEKEEAESGEDKDFMYWLNHVGDDAEPKKEAPKDKSPDQVQGLLDQFLATKRSKPIQTRSFYNVHDKALESETDNMEVISETLVAIYEKQGHFDLAIKGYEKLSLQNPSKSAYFAARITEIKQKQAHLK